MSKSTSYGFFYFVAFRHGVQAIKHNTFYSENKFVNKIPN